MFAKFLCNYVCFCVLAVLMVLPVTPVFGVIIFLNGTSSAGKTAVARELESELGFSCEKITFDDVIWDQLIKKACELHYLPEDISRDRAQKILESFERHTMDDLWRQTQVDVRSLYTLVRERAATGKHILVDAVIKHTDEIHACLRELRDFMVYVVLVYCPITLLPARVEQRNISGVQGEKRLVRWAAQEFVTMYQATENNDRACIELVEKKQIYDFLQAVRDEFSTIALQEAKQVTPEVLAAADEWHAAATADFTKRFFLQSAHDKIFLKPTVAYDVVINTGIYSPREGAEQIKKYLKENCILI